MARLSNILNQKFGKLTVVELLEKRDCYGRRRWRCVCDCGGEKISTANVLKSGYVQSCGCLKQNCIEAMKRATSLNPLEAYLHNMYSQTRYRSGQRNIKFELTVEQFISVCTQNCYYCGEKDNRIHNKRSGNVEVKCTGVDRIDSNKDYTLDNTRPCCKTCNQIKSSLDETQLFNKIEKIYKNRIKKGDLMGRGELTQSELKDMLENWQNQLAIEVNKGYNNSHTAIFARKLIAAFTELLERRGKDEQN